ncbi:MAG TPA: hypothetical protein VGP47_10845 [Parachlamydiaceae bacterium]|nr:hypothetical protein [Parachlamydiaceae bacterium]
MTTPLPSNSPVLTNNGAIQTQTPVADQRAKMAGANLADVSTKILQCANKTVENKSNSSSLTNFLFRSGTGINKLSTRVANSGFVKSIKTALNHESFSGLRNVSGQVREGLEKSGSSIRATVAGNQAIPKQVVDNKQGEQAEQMDGNIEQKESQPLASTAKSELTHVQNLIKKYTDNHANLVIGTKASPEKIAQIKENIDELKDLIGGKMGVNVDSEDGSDTHLQKNNNAIRFEHTMSMDESKELNVLLSQFEEGLEKAEGELKANSPPTEKEVVAKPDTPYQMKLNKELVQLKAEEKRLTGLIDSLKSQKNEAEAKVNEAIVLTPGSPDIATFLKAHTIENSTRLDRLKMTEIIQRHNLQMQPNAIANLLSMEVEDLSSGYYDVSIKNAEKDKENCLKDIEIKYEQKAKNIMT